MELPKTNQTPEGPRKDRLRRRTQLTKGGLEKRGQDKCLKQLLDWLGEKGCRCLLLQIRKRSSFREANSSSIQRKTSMFHVWNGLPFKQRMPNIGNIPFHLDSCYSLLTGLLTSALASENSILFTVIQAIFFSNLNQI